MSLQEVSNSVRFSELELGVLARWQRERTFERSLARRRGAPRFVYKRLRDKVKAVAAAVKRGEVRELPDGRFEAAGELLAADEVTRRFVAHGAAVATEGGLVVALDLAVDEALAREGLAREVNRAVQDLRKQARLAYGDRVQVGIAGDSALIDAMLAEHPAWLGEQGLATIARAAVPDPIGAAALEVGGATLEVSIART